MSKNTTRKGLAFGAGLALVASGFVGVAPANATGIDNGFVSLSPASGTAYRVLADGTFDLKANGVSSIQNGGGSANLKFLVQDPDKRTKADWSTATTAAVAYSAAKATAPNKLDSVIVSSNGTVVTATVTAPALDATNKLVGHSATVAPATTIVNGKVFTQTAATTATYSTTGLTDATLTITGAVLERIIGLNSRPAILAADPGAVFEGTAELQATIGGVAVDPTTKRLADGSYVVDTKTNTNANDRILRLVNTDAAKTTSVTVTAWVDDNNNGVIDGTEYRSPAREVSFHVNADLTVTSTIDTPVLGTAAGPGAITGTVSIAPELNGQQVGNSGAVTATIVPQAGTIIAVVPTYSATSKLWNIAGETDTAIAQGNYSLRASVASAAIGNTASAFVSARVAAYTEMSTVGTVDQQQSFNDDQTNPATGVKVRKDKAVTVVIDPLTSTGAAVPVGRSVSVIFTPAATTTTWTVNGTQVLAVGTASVTRTYTTDANGQVVLTIASGSGLGEISVEARPEGLTGANAAKTTFTWEAATFSIVDTNSPSRASAADARRIATGGSYTYNLFAKDQWNAPLAGSYRVQVTTTGRTNFGGNFELVNGRAAVTVSDAALGGGSTITVTTQLQKLTGSTWANSTDANAFGSSTITVADASTAALIPAVVYTGGTAATLSPKAIQAYDVNGSQSNLENPRGTNVAVIQLNMAGIGVGDLMTVSGTDLSFAYAEGTAAGSTIKAIGNGSLTFVVDNTAHSIQVVSNKALTKAVVTFTHGSRTGTAEVSFTAALADSVKSVNIAAPASATPGSTFQVVATLTDVFGNPVAIASTDTSGVTVSYSGPGIVFGDLPSTTDKNGQLKFAVLLGSNDSGTATVTVTYNKVKATAVATNIITQQATVQVGTQVGTARGWTRFLSATNELKIYARDVVGAGKIQFFVNNREIAWINATDANDPKLNVASDGIVRSVFVADMQTGRNVIEIYEDGVRLDRRIFTK